MKPRILVFATGSKTGGGSGFRNLFDSTVAGFLDATIVAVVSNIPDGGVFRHAQETGVPFVHFPGPWDAESYRELYNRFKPDLICLSGWLKFIVGIKECLIINIHPGRLPQTAGLHGCQVHTRALELYAEDPTFTTAVTMHTVPYQEVPNPNDYDTGEIFFELPVGIKSDDTPETLAARVNKKERLWQPYITNLVVHKLIP